MDFALPRAVRRASSGVTSAPPLLVRNDPWLEPYQGAIERRIERFNKAMAALGPGTSSLAAYASGHKFMGIHCNPMAGHWSIREWAPAARALSLIGDFNGWNRERHPLTPADRGIWQLELPVGALDHGQQVKLHVLGADGSRRDRIPACIRRAVQDPNNHDFAGQIWQPPQPYKWRHAFDPGLITSPLIYEAHVGMSGEEGRVPGPDRGPALRMKHRGFRRQLRFPAEGRLRPKRKGLKSTPRSYASILSRALSIDTIR